MSELPPKSWTTEQEAGRALRAERRFAEAAAAYGRAADLNPAGTARLFQGLSLRDAGDMAGALAALERHVAAQPGSFDGWTTLGMTHRNAGAPDAALKKVGEEAAEVIMAAKDGVAEKTISEMADLWFHCLVALVQAGIRPEQVLAELARREGISGLDEKAARRAQQKG